MNLKKMMIMKKQIIILVVIAIGAMLFKGDIPSRMTLFNLTVPTGTDTTYYFEFWHQEPWGLEIQYKLFDASDATIDLGACSYPDGSTFNRLDNASLPYTLADSSWAIEKATFNFKYLACKLTPNSVTSGIGFQLIMHTETKVVKAP